MNEFKREVRYTVIKHNQLTEAQMGFLKNCIFGEGIPTVECVVIESDWPEYETVWAMLKDRAEKQAALALLTDIENWLVCSCIATPEDMAQSFEHYQKQIEALLRPVVQS